MTETCFWPSTREVTITQGARSWKSVEPVMLSAATWNGQAVALQVDLPIADCVQHELVVMDHYGHPTGLLMCRECIGVADNPDGPPRCTWADCWHHTEPGWCDGDDGCARRTPAAAGGEG